MLLLLVLSQATAPLVLTLVSLLVWLLLMVQQS
jgi:hypothetical protein